MGKSDVGEAAEREQLGDTVLDQMQTLHAIKSGALRMFESMTDAVRDEREKDTFADVQDLLEKMTKAFGGHEDATRAHERRLRERLDALGSGRSRPREIGLGAAAEVRAALGRAGGQNYGANARDAFVFEHMEIATAGLLELLAERAGDEETAKLARECRSDDEEMAETIRGNFPNVLSLMLASEGLPTLRDDRESEA